MLHNAEKITRQQYTRKVTLRCVCITLLLWKSNKYYICWVCVCSLRYPACKVHAPYYVIYGASGSCTFSLLSRNGIIFGKKNVTKYLSEIFLILRKIQPVTVINLHRSLCKIQVIFVRF